MIDSYRESKLSKCDLNDVLKECSVLICLISVGNEFHCLAPSLENDFEKLFVLANGTLRSSLFTERKFLICISNALVNKSSKYSGACPFNFFIYH